MLNILNMINPIERNSYTMQYILNTFKAFVEVIIPWSPQLAAEYGELQYYGAIDLLAYEYIIQSLNEYGGSSLVVSTAKTLDAIARQIIVNEDNKNITNVSKGTIFADLAPSDRLLAINLMKQYETNSSDNQVAITDSLIRLTMMGYYSEWFGYGTTRLKGPNQRIFEFKPLSWEQVEYPGSQSR
ncbi:MAG: hypothetical protein ACERKZ_03735 [Lachnotalea sp.]